MLAFDSSDDQRSRFVGGSGRNLQEVRVVPQLLSFLEVDAVLFPASETFREIQEPADD